MYDYRHGMEVDYRHGMEVDYRHGMEVDYRHGMEVRRQSIGKASFGKGIGP